MTRLRPAAAALAALLALGALPAFGQDGFAMKKEIVVAPGETQDNVFTLGGTVRVEGRVAKSVVAIGGAITISGEVGDAVVGVGSRVVLTKTAVVSGDVVALGGTLEREDGSTVRGDTVFFNSADIGRKVFRPDVIRGALSMSLIPFLLVFKLVTFFLWLLMGLLGAALLPRQIVAASNHLRQGFWQIFGIGFLAIVVFAGLLLASALLSLILIGIPLFLAVVFAALIVMVFGRVAMFYFFGESLLKALGAQRVTPLGAVLLGLVIVTLAGLVPLVGFLFIFVVNIIGWGLAIHTKFGTKPA